MTTYPVIDRGEFLWTGGDSPQLLLRVKDLGLSALNMNTFEPDIQPGIVPVMVSRLNPESSLRLSPLEDQVYLPDGSTGALEYPYYPPALSPDGNAVVMIGEDQIIIWQPENTQTIPLPDELHEWRFDQIAWGPSLWIIQAKTGRIVSCPGGLIARLDINQTGRVVAGTGANNLREQPTTASNVIDNIPPLHTFTVLDGPQCSGDYTWWQVDYEGTIGWTAEGDGNTYWLEPVR